MKIIIRLEQKADFLAIYDFTKEAFKTAKVKDGQEQEFVDRLRNSEHYLPELAFVAEEETEIIGHIMLTETSIISDEKDHIVLILAPLSVRLDQRSKGIGGKLIATAENKAKNMGYGMILLVGDPSYYNRYGYEQASNLGIIPDVQIPNEYILAKRINESSIEDFSGTVLIPV